LAKIRNFQRVDALRRRFGDALRHISLTPLGWKGRHAKQTIERPSLQLPPPVQQ
jgi:hypothetical protein